MTETPLGRPDHRVAAVVGLGAAGRRHVSVIRTRVPDCRVIGVRRPGSAPSPLVDRTVDDVRDAVAEHPSLAVVAGPSSLRLAAATPFLEAGIPVLLEKPIASDPEAARALRRVAARANVVVAVGYNLRYHRPVEQLCEIVARGQIGRVLSVCAAVGQHLSQWRPGTNYRNTVSASSATGGGALLELSHELDLALRLGGDVSSVAAQTRAHSDLALEVEESADVLLSFASGAVANVHLDLYNRTPVREVTVIGSRGTVRLDVIAGVLTLDAEGQHVRRAYADVIADSYVRQLDAFLGQIEHGATADAAFETAVAVVDVVQAAKRSATTGCTVPLAPAGHVTVETGMAAR